MRQPKRARVQTRYRIAQNTLVIDLGKVHRVLSSAPRGGGLARARCILNHQVEANPAAPRRSILESETGPPICNNPSRYLRTVASTVGAERDCVGLMTAVPMKQLVADREESGGLWVECFCTVGVTNAVRAGESSVFQQGSLRRPAAGTINIILITNATLSTSAMVGAIQVVTESKTAALIDRKIPSWTGCPGATGTGTDAVVIASALRGGPKLQYSGTHTEIGAMIGRLVSRSVLVGLKRARRWKRLNTKGTEK